MVILAFTRRFPAFLRCCFGHIVRYAHLRNVLNIEKYPMHISLK